MKNQFRSMYAVECVFLSMGMVQRENRSNREKEKKLDKNNIASVKTHKIESLSIMAIAIFGIV